MKISQKFYIWRKVPLQRRAVTMENDIFIIGNMVFLTPWKISFPMVCNMFSPFFDTILPQSHGQGQSARIYRPGFIEKNDHVISWNKDFLSQVSWLEKKTSDFFTFNFCLYQQKRFLNCEIYMDQRRWRL